MGDGLYLYHTPTFTLKLNPICKVCEVKSNGRSYTENYLCGGINFVQVKLVYEAYQNCKRLERVVGMTSMIGVQKQISMQECELESDERRCSNPPDGSRRELSAGNVTPPLGASACVLEQLPSQQRAGAECENWNPRTPLEEPWKRNNNKVVNTH
ncbi:unnamed protein product [Musa textilis]